MAICPTEAVQVEGLTYGEDLFNLPPVGMAASDLSGFLAHRRSVRVFQDRPVPRQVLQEIVDAMAMAPMGFPPHKTEVTVVQSRGTIEEALPLIVQRYEDLAAWMRNPFIRLMIRRRTSAAEYRSLSQHVLPSLAYRLPDMKAGQGDTLTRGAPAMLLLHASNQAESAEADAWIALTYGLLAAHSLGLGATALSLIPPVVDRTPKLRELVRIPAENRVLACMVLGYARHRFQRGIRRELAAVHWVQ